MSPTFAVWIVQRGIASWKAIANVPRGTRFPSIVSPLSWEGEILFSLFSLHLFCFSVSTHHFVLFSLFFLVSTFSQFFKVFTEMYVYLCLRLALIPRLYTRMTYFSPFNFYSPSFGLRRVQPSPWGSNQVSKSWRRRPREHHQLRGRGRRRGRHDGIRHHPAPNPSRRERGRIRASSGRTQFINVAKEKDAKM